MPQADAVNTTLAPAFDPFALGGWLLSEIQLAARHLITVRAEFEQTTNDEDGGLVWSEAARLQKIILFAEPESMEDVAAKLRLVCDPHIGLECGDRTDGGDLVALRQSLAFIETQIGRPPHGRIVQILKAVIKQPDGNRGIYETEPTKS